jgi:hypothetical protein
MKRVTVAAGIQQDAQTYQGRNFLDLSAEMRAKFIMDFNNQDCFWFSSLSLSDVHQHLICTTLNALDAIALSNKLRSFPAWREHSQVCHECQRHFSGRRTRRTEHVVTA